MICPRRHEGKEQGPGLGTTRIESHGEIANMNVQEASSWKQM